jgi:hypothetical protein
MRICNTCGAECDEWKCPCSVAYYCGVDCQNIDWPRHGPRCILAKKNGLSTDLITVERIQINEDEMNDFLLPKENDKADSKTLERKIYRCNAATISMSILKEKREEGIIYAIREKKRTSAVRFYV